MKIVCESCGAKYSIADEKIAGKVFKIRCKKCSHVLVVRGDQVSADQPASGGGAAAASPSAAPAASDAIWHVVIAGDQQGPYAPGQLAQMMTAGQIDWEAYVWREGFEGWVPARDVPELVEAISGGGAAQQQAAAEPQPAAAQPAATAGLGDDPFAQTGAGGLGADPFGEDESTRVADAGAFAGGAEAQAPAAEPAGLGGGSPDLFAQAQAADPTSASFEGVADGGDVVASQPGPRVSAEQALTGQRNENSVLFSLSNLQALATGGSETSSSPLSSPGGSEGASPKPGYAGGEGSGLIDIRALASAAATTGGEQQDEHIDQLLSIGGAPVGPGLAAPVLAPPVEAEKDNKKLYIGLAAGGGALAVVAVLALVLMGGGDEEKPASPPMAAATTQQAAQPAAGAAPGAAPGAAAKVPPAQPAAPAQAAAKPAEPSGGTAAAGSEGAPSAGGNEAPSAGSNEAEADSERSSRRSTRSGRGSRRPGRRRSGSGGSASAARPSAPSGGSSSRSRRRSGGGGDIESLLDQAIGGGGGRSGSRRSSSGGGSSNANLPSQPSRSQVLAAMGRVKGAVSRCAQAGEKGRTVTAAITVRGSTGRVSGVNVSGSVSPGTRSCVARAVRRASFPKFKKDMFKINFPFRL